MVIKNNMVWLISRVNLVLGYVELDRGVEIRSRNRFSRRRKKTGPKAGFSCSLPEITWREPREQREQQRQQERRRERQRQRRERREPEQQEPERLQQREREPELLLFCHKQTGTGPAERRAGRYISLCISLGRLINMLIASVFRG